MKFINIKRFKNNQHIYKIDYSDNNNLICATSSWMYDNYKIYDVITSEVLLEILNVNIIHNYDLNNIINNYEVNNLLQKTYYDDDKEYIIELSHKLRVSNSPRALIRSTDYGYAGWLDYVYLINSKNKDYIKVCFFRDKKLIKSDFKFLTNGRLLQFLFSPTEVNKFIFVHQEPKSKGKITVQNHNYCFFPCEREPLLAYSPDNKNIALTVREPKRKLSNNFSILDTETLQLRYKMEVPLYFNKMLFSQDGNKLALISSDTILEIDVD